MAFGRVGQGFEAVRGEIHNSEIGNLPRRIGQKGEAESLPDKFGVKRENLITIQEGLTNKERQEIQKECGWKKEIVEGIESKRQLEIYKKADLHEEMVNTRECLVKNIDINYIDPKTDMTNLQRMQRGLSPIDAKTGEKIELHHMGQSFHSPFAELTENSEHGDGNHSILHTKHEDSWRNDPEKVKEYQIQKKAHWIERAETFKELN